MTRVSFSLSMVRSLFPICPVNVARLGCDFFAFSGHKMLGPTGTGVLWMKEPVIDPMIFGGGMVETVTRTGFTTAEGYQKYEAGTPNIGGGIGLGVAAEYLQKIGMERIQQYEEALTKRLITGLEQIEHVHVYAPPPTSLPYRCCLVQLLMECILMKLPSTLMRPQISWCDPDTIAASH